MKSLWCVTLVMLMFASSMYAEECGLKATEFEGGDCQCINSGSTICTGYKSTNYNYECGGDCEAPTCCVLSGAPVHKLLYTRWLCGEEATSCSTTDDCPKGDGDGEDKFFDPQGCECS